MEECHAEINGEGVDHLAFFTADFLNQEAGTDLIVEQVVLLVACIKFDMSERCEGNGENPSAFLRKQNADDVQLLFDIGGKLVEFFIEIILFFVGICSADHNAVLVLHSVFFTVFINIKRFHSLYFLYTYPLTPRTETSPEEMARTSVPSSGRTRSSPCMFTPIAVPVNGVRGSRTCTGRPLLIRPAS